MKSGKFKGSLALLLVLAAAGALLLAGLGDIPLTDRDEGEYAAAVAAMRASGDWLVPTLNGRLYLEKPILVYWAVAGSQALAGDNEIGARLPSALAAFALVLACGLMTWRASGRPGLGALAAAALAFSPLFVLVGRACLTDALLSLWTTLALLWVWLALEQPEGEGGRWWLLAWAALGLGFLTKGPVALAVVLPSAGIYALIQGRLVRAIKQARWLWGILIFLVINLPWYGLVWWHLGDKFIDAFFISQNLRRFSETLLGHGGGLFYYLPVLLLGAFPFAALALPELGRALGQNPKAQRQEDPLAGLRLLAAVSLLVVLVVFSLAATKQINYVLPGLPFLAILAGCALDRLVRGELGGRLARPVFWALLWLGGGLLTLALAAVPAALPLLWGKIEASIRFDSSEYALPLSAPVMVLWPLLAALFAAVAAFGVSGTLRRGRSRLAAWLLTGGAAVFCGVVFLGLLPQAADSIQTPAKALAREVARRATPEARVVTYGLWKPSLIYYVGRDLPRYRVEQGPELAKVLAGTQPVYVLSRARLSDRLKALPGLEALDQQQGYLLAGNPAGAAAWRGEAPPPVEAPEPQTPQEPTVSPEPKESTPPKTPQDSQEPRGATESRPPQEPKKPLEPQEPTQPQSSHAPQESL